MPLYELTEAGIDEVKVSTFAEMKLYERGDLQRALRSKIASITPGTETMVLSEEFGLWDDAKRRIDLLCLDAERNLVVVEIKRTETGGHMELQALRYAAMVSTMRFDQAVDAHRKYLEATGKAADDAETSIRSFLGLEEGIVAFTDKVRIVLASAGFSTEVTTAVLWLNAQGLDIRCVQMRPHDFGGKTLLDIQQVIPLPEAAEYQIAIREKSVEQAAAEVGGRDFTRFDLTVGSENYPNLPKRRLIYQVMREVVRLGVAPEAMSSVIPWRASALFISAEGQLSREQLIAACPGKSATRYFCSNDELVFCNGRTYALTNQWGDRTDEAVLKILSLAPSNHQISYQKTMSV